MGNLSFYRDGPLFGLDIGHSSLKVMQLEKTDGQAPKVLGYGLSEFPTKSIVDGVITDPQALAKSIYSLFDNGLIGEISTRRVACSLPTSLTFSRYMEIPKMEDEDIKEAIRLEAEQYIPVPLAELYLDYEISRRSGDKIELLMVATRRKIVDSYLTFLEALKLEPVAIEPSINAASRLVSTIDAVAAADPLILIDFGSISTDLAVLDKTIFVNSTVSFGANTLTESIAKELNVAKKEALVIKNKYGLGVSDQQSKILKAVEPSLDSLSKELDKVMRYYTEHSEHKDRKIAQIFTLGGGAIMPGLNQYISKELHLPTSLLEPWNKFDFGELAPPSGIDSSTYITVAGQAMLNPQEIYP